MNDPHSTRLSPSFPTTGPNAMNGKRSLLLDPAFSFPDPLDAGPEGLVAIGGDLSVPRLLLAYQRGIFPWYSEGEPIVWWSPDPRMIIEPEGLRVTRSLRKSLRNRGYEVSADKAFPEVVQACAQAGERLSEGTWITTEMKAAFERLHRLGVAHSIEVWHNGRLVGGLYGLYLGAVFCGESMFSVERDASKVAMVHLVSHLKKRPFHFIDCQLPTEHLARLGGVSIPRRDFLKRLEAAIRIPTEFSLWKLEPAPSNPL